MQSPKRPDFISKNQTADGNATSYGCAMLFIYYLHSQLGFSLPAIFNKAGGTLEKTYPCAHRQEWRLQGVHQAAGMVFPDRRYAATAI
jgi:hypothetical protein